MEESVHEKSLSRFACWLRHGTSISLTKRSCDHSQKSDLELELYLPASVHNGGSGMSNQLHELYVTRREFIAKLPAILVVLLSRSARR
jgi:hypothetical protein